jgi:hypothetical protein
MVENGTAGKILLVASKKDFDEFSTVFVSRGAGNLGFASI